MGCKKFKNIMKIIYANLGGGIFVRFVIKIIIFWILGILIQYFYKKILLEEVYGKRSDVPYVMSMIEGAGAIMC